MEQISTFLARALPHGVDRVVFLTGAGISAESGIPTFRGKEGYWRVGSRNYQPEELATRAAFERMPEALWAWYLHRRAICLGALPNAAHEALAALDADWQRRCLLVTQNVDGLHHRAGHAGERTYEIHGNLHYMRCARGGASCSLSPVPKELSAEWARDKQLSRKEERLLRCGRCGGATRPHVLWFDESYDEETFRFESALRAVEEASLFVIIGTSGQTNLPMQMGLLAFQRGTPVIVINQETNLFSERASHEGRQNLFLQGLAGTWVPLLIDGLRRSEGP